MTLPLTAFSNPFDAESVATALSCGPVVSAGSEPSGRNCTVLSSVGLTTLKVADFGRTSHAKPDAQNRLGILTVVS